MLHPRSFRLFNEPLLFGAWLAAAPVSAQAQPDNNVAHKPPVRIEILRVENTYLGEKGISESRVVWKTSEPVLYQLRRGYNCHSGEAVDKVAYSGVTQAEKENTLRIRAGALRQGNNPLSICVNRAPLTAASSDNLDYGSDVYEKNLTVFVDNLPPQTVYQLFNGEEKNMRISLSCVDDGICETIAYVIEGNGRSENFSEKSRSLTINLSATYPWAENIRFYSTDKAGNREAEQQVKLNSDEYPWFGHGRLSLSPGYLMRIATPAGLPSGGFGVGIAADFPLAKILSRPQNIYLPALRFEGRLLTFSNGTATEENAGEIAAGALWLKPLKNGAYGALSGGATLGAAKYFSIVDSRTVATAFAASVNLFAGYEYSVAKYFFFAHWRALYLVTPGEPFLGHGPALGAGVVF